jgi:transposase InsO family protein
MKMCEVMQVSRSGFYSWSRRKPSRRKEENKVLLEEIKKIHKDSKEILGSPSICSELNDKGLKCSRPRVARIMKENGIHSKIKRKFKVTTNSKHTYSVCPNLLSERPPASRIDEHWVADITYIRTQEGWLYLSAVMDEYRRKIISWVTSASLSKEIVTKAIWQALKTRTKTAGVQTIFHSDRGVQYAATATKNMLKQNGILQSMSGKGNCYDNATMESFFHTLKVQHVYHHNYKTREEAVASLFWYIEVFYNGRKKHSALGNLSPKAFEERERKKAA